MVVGRRRAGPSHRQAGHQRHSNAVASRASHGFRIWIVARKQAGQSWTGRMTRSPIMLINATRRIARKNKIAATVSSN